MLVFLGLCCLRGDTLEEGYGPRGKAAGDAPKIRPQAKLVDDRWRFDENVSGCDDAAHVDFSISRASYRAQPPVVASLSKVTLIDDPVQFPAQIS